MIIAIIILTFLALMSYLDIKEKSIISILPTAFIILLIALYPQNLYFGIIGFLFALLIYEGGYFSGVADIKILGALSLLCFNWYSFTLFLIICLIFGILYKLSFVIANRKFNLTNEDCAFIPVFLISFITYKIILKINFLVFLS